MATQPLSLIFSSCPSFQEHNILTYCISRCKILSTTQHTLSHFSMQIPSTAWHTLSHFLMSNPFRCPTHSTTLADANSFHRLVHFTTFHKDKSLQLPSTHFHINKVESSNIETQPRVNGAPKKNHSHNMKGKK